MPAMPDRSRAACSVFVLLFGAFAAGCAQTDVAVSQYAERGLPKPDRVLVRNFAVTRGEVDLDARLGPSLLRDASGEVESEEARKVGRAAAEALSVELVKELREKGIAAERANRQTPYTETTLMVAGQFQTLDGGDQTPRTLVGFGLGGGEVRALVKVFQGGRLVAEAETSAGTTIASELTMTSVEEGSRRTAREIAYRIHDAYLKRGWLER